MTKRKRSTRFKSQRVRLRGIERALFVGGAVLYVVGVFGGFGLLAMPAFTAILLLMVGGGSLFATLLMVMR